MLSMRPPRTSDSPRRAWPSEMATSLFAAARPLERAARVPSASPTSMVFRLRSAISLRLRSTCAVRSAIFALAMSALEARGPSAAVAALMACDPAASPARPASPMLAARMALSSGSGPALRVARAVPVPPPARGMPRPVPPPLPTLAAAETCPAPAATLASDAEARAAARSMRVAVASTNVAVAPHALLYVFRPLSAASASRTSFVTSVRIAPMARGYR